MPKKLIFLFAGIVILAGGTALALKLLGVWPFSSPTNTTVQTLNEGVNKTKKPLPKNEITIKMDPIFIPIIQKNKVALNLKLEMSIVCDKGSEQLLKQKLPILKDAYIQDLFSFIPRKLRKNSKLDKGTLKRRLEIIGNKTVGKGKILSINIINYSEAAEDEISTKSDAKDKDKDKDSSKSKEETSKD